MSVCFYLPSLLLACLLLLVLLPNINMFVSIRKISEINTETLPETLLISSMLMIVVIV